MAEKVYHVKDINWELSKEKESMMESILNIGIIFDNIKKYHNKYLSKPDHSEHLYSVLKIALSDMDAQIRFFRGRLKCARTLRLLK